MLSKTFWKDFAERSVRTFAQALGGFFVAGVTITSVSWEAALVGSATAALGSVLLSLSAIGKGDHDSASLVSRPGQHSAGE